MDDRRWLTERFTQHRVHLRAVAYRMLGSLDEADDAVQEAWLRPRRADGSEVENLAGWLTTVVARVCLDMLRSRKARPEEPLGHPSARPVVSRGRGRPEQQALLADSVGLALLVVLETLGPAERLAFVLHDMFAVPFEEIAPMVERTPDGDPATGQPCPPPGQERRARPARRSDPPAGRSSKPSWPPPAAGTSML